MVIGTSATRSTDYEEAPPPGPEKRASYSQQNLSKAEGELKKESEQWFQRDSDGLEREGFLPTVTFPDKQAQVEGWTKEAQQFETDFSEMEMKIHMFPASLRGLSRRYIAPMAVVIGPYHHSLRYMHEMEKVKHVAAHHFIRDSGYTFDEMYAAVFSVIGTARGFYDTNNAKVNVVGDAEFADMMFIDGCFLLQYMLMCTDHDKLPPSLLSCFESNQACISNDIMLLENQLPWLVIEILRKFRYVPVENFIGKMGRTLQIRGDMDRAPVVLNGRYKPPHLLGMLWFYKTGSGNSSVTLSDPDGFRSMSKSISAIELEEIGIKLTAGKTSRFTDMGIKKGFLSCEIFLAPLFLDDIRSCWLVNMAAFEVSVGMATCVGKETYHMKAVVCSYLAVLAMLMDREEDVHELRSKQLVQGELTNKETLDFFKMLVKRINGGSLYIHIMTEIEAYKLNRWMWIKVHRFVYKNIKGIFAVFSIIGVLVGIFKTLLSLKKQ